MSVPIVDGPRKKYEKFMPHPKSMIFVDEFESPKELAAYLNELSHNDTAYLEYFQYRNDCSEFLNYWHSFESYQCQMCRKVQQWNREYREDNGRTSALMADKTCVEEMKYGMYDPVE